MVLFSDEWGGGGAAYCRKDDPKNWGADAIFKIVNGKMVFQSYYKLPGAADAARELRRAQRIADSDSGPHDHGAGVVSGRHLDLRVDRSRRTRTRSASSTAARTTARALMGGGFWSVVLVQRPHHRLRDAARSRHLRADAERARSRRTRSTRRRSVQFDFLNVQDQPKFVWPATFALSRSYTDQLERWKGLSADKVATVRTALRGAEGMSGVGASRCAERAGGAGRRLHERLGRSVSACSGCSVDQGSGESQLITR